ncbi:MAG: TIGR03862 family flavoprotein [Comamonadaceae bacterium]|nr:TIGR03862 family flavoprotein [Comamonadaceae bacterium]
MIQKVMVIGAGPAGLMAAEVLSQAGIQVEVYDAMPSAGRKFLLAGKGGLNLTHSEPDALFVSRYGQRSAEIAVIFQTFGAKAVRAWASSLGVDTFIGSSGRVFPVDMKAAPLLRAWLHRLRHPASGPPVRFFMRYRWTGQVNDSVRGIGLSFDTPAGMVSATADAVVMAFGGGSWAKLGSDGAWVPWLQARGVGVAPLLPANCGFDRFGGWSEHFVSRFAGQPFKSVAVSLTSLSGATFQRKGEFVATATGVEGSLIYAASGILRNDILKHGQASFLLDLLPDLSADRILAEVTHPRGSRSLSSHLKSRLRLDGIKMAILHEVLSTEQLHDGGQLARAIKALPITLAAARPLDEAISSAGGVLFESMNQHQMLNAWPGVFCAGEMLDWEAPTGGYLLTACLASGASAGHGVVRYIQGK